MPTKITELNHKQIKSIQKKINENWIKLGHHQMPPNKTNVLVRVEIGNGHIQTHTGRFVYDHESCVQLGRCMIPLNKARHHGVLAWMPIPN